MFSPSQLDQTIAKVAEYLWGKFPDATDLKLSVEVLAPGESPICSGRSLVRGQGPKLLRVDPPAVAPASVSLPAVAPSPTTEPLPTLTAIGGPRRTYRRVRGIKLTVEQVRQIRAEFAAGASLGAITARWGISPSHASRVVNRMTWKRA